MKTITALIIGLSALLAGCQETSGPVLTPHIRESARACLTNGGLAKIDDAQRYMSVGDNSTDTYSCEATCNNGAVFSLRFR